MQIIPLEQIPNQSFNIVLGEQNCIIHLYQRSDYMYIDISANGTSIRQGAICLTNIDLLNYPLLGFSGILFFGDLKGKNGVPNYAELGTRYVLFYATEDELNV